MRDRVEVEAVEALELKGKVEPVRAWRLLRISDGISGLPPRLRSPMVGRDRQLAQLRQAFEAAVDEVSCQLFTILGPAGVGKSRLVAEFLSGIGSRANVLRGRCLPYGEGITYRPVVEAIKQAAGVADFDPPEAVETKVRAVLDGDEHQELVCRHVAQLMGAAGPAAGEETFWAIRRFFEASGHELPLVLVFDDIQWGEPTFLDLVEHIADWSSRGSSVLLLCMARSDLLDVRPMWGGGKRNATTVSLEPLSEEKTETLIANLLGSADLPIEVAETIVQTAEGNPLFVEETLGMLIDEGLLTREEGRWVVAGDLSTIAVPPSIQALLAARLDRLGPEERATLEAAAVAGKQFFVSAVRDLVPESVRLRMPSDLMALVRKELIRPDRTTLPGEDAFRFRHLLIRDAAYDAIPKGRRAEMHERFAGWLERTAGEVAAEYEEILGYHLEQAHVYLTELAPANSRTATLARRAPELLGSAGLRAAAREDYHGAENLLSRSVRLWPSEDVAGRARPLLRLVDLLITSGEFFRAQELIEEATEAAGLTGDGALEARAEIRLTRLRARVDPTMAAEQALRRMENTIEVLARLGDEAGLAEAWTEVGFFLLGVGHYEEGAAALDRARAFALRSHDPWLDYRVEFEGLEWPDQGPRTASEEADRARKVIVGGTERRSVVAHAHVSLAHLRAMQGQREGAREHVEAGSAILEDLGLKLPLAANVALVSAQIEMLVSDPAAAEGALRPGIEVLQALGSTGLLADRAAFMGRILCELGRYEEALQFAQLAERSAAPDDMEPQLWLRGVKARVLARKGAFEEAERWAREDVDMAERTDWLNFQGDAFMDLAEVLRLMGRVDEARKNAQQAVELFEQKGNKVMSSRARAFPSSWWQLLEARRGSRPSARRQMVSAPPPS